jgi:ferritin-like metal-binding protein YciE
MFERFNTPEEAYEFKLGAALTMEREVLGILLAGIDAARGEKVQDLLRDHHNETLAHVKAVEAAFGLLCRGVDDSPCPAIKGLDTEVRANLKKADEAIVDSVVLQGAVEVEHHEIAVYENLLIEAEAMGRDDVVDMLERNISSEQSTLLKLKTMLAEVAAEAPREARA